MYLTNITMAELETSIKKNPIVIIPLGSLEEHGPHLPLGTDTIQIEEVLKIVERRTNVFIAPSINYGVCRSTEEHIGTVSITPQTLRNLIIDLLSGFKKQGFKVIFLISGHAGKLHSFSVIEACENFVKENPNLRIFYFTEFDLFGNDIYNLIETDYDSHAGEIETSRILYINNKLVKGNYKKLESDQPQFPKGEIVIDKLKYWKSGIWGDPAKASKEKGRKSILLSANKIIEIIQEIKRGLKIKP